MPLAAPSATSSPVPPFARTWLFVCLAAVCAQGYAAEAPETRVHLRPASTIAPADSRNKPLEGPTFIEADVVHGHVGSDIEASGNVIAHNLRERIETDALHYDQRADQVQTRGRTLLLQGNDRFEGRDLKLKLTDRLGEFHDVRFQLQSTRPTDTRRVDASRGQAKTLQFKGTDHYQLDQASYTTCPLESPDWVLKMQELELDYGTNVGIARQVHVEYFNTPILYVPWMDFSLDDRRKSGFLAPSYGVSTERGLELVVPWYWNIAPNRDATVVPRVMAKRGMQLGGEFRYLEPRYQGDLNLEYLPNDKVSKRDRYLGIWRHKQQFGSHWTAAVDIQSASDDAYFVDLSSQVAQTSRVNLPRQLELSYNLDWLNAKALLQSFQTLQDPAATIFAPYQRMPQITVAAGRGGQLGNPLQWDLAAEFVAFDRPGKDAVEGRRLHLNPSFSYPLRTPYATITPKAGWFFTRYDLDSDSITRRDTLDRTSATTPMPAGGAFASVSRNMPMFSLDTSLVMEREQSYFGRNFIQTLEPRLYYLYIPYREQSLIPVFDTGIGDLSLDQVFGENQYVGVDRINDANQLTMAFTSRFLEQSNGAERLAVTLGQRYYFNDQRVTFPGQASRGSNTTDLLALVSGQINNSLRLYTGIQFNTDDGELAKANFGGTWRDGPGRVFNADYRYTSKQYASAGLNQIDLSGQWPLAPKWYGVGRLNYSIQDARMVEGLAGLEYNAGCWSLRGVMQRLATTQDTVSNAFFLQLELRGLTKLGPNPLDILKRSISGYAKSDDFNQP